MQKFLISVMAAGLAIALASCSYLHDIESGVSQLGEGIAATGELTSLTEALREIPGVTTADWSLVPISRTASLNVGIDDGVATSVLVNVASTVRSVMLGDALGPYQREFTMTIGGNSQLHESRFDMTADELMAEFSYWRSVEQAIGARLEFTLDGTSSTGPTRHLHSSNDSTTVLVAKHYDAIKAMSEASGIEASWSLPGLSSGMSLPDNRALGIVGAMAGTTNLLGERDQESPPGIIVSAPTGHPVMTVISISAAVEANVSRSADWSQVVTAARLTLASGQPSVLFRLESMGGEPSSVYWFFIGDCIKAAPTPDDRSFTDALTAAGVVLPATAGAGFCESFATQ